MIETAAQLASYAAQASFKGDRFWGFGGVDAVKFRDAITPPARLYILGQALEMRPRRTVCQVQGIVEGRMAFEAKITGMPV